jgi:hypothetical protein
MTSQQASMASEASPATRRTLGEVRNSRTTPIHEVQEGWCPLFDA